LYVLSYILKLAHPDKIIANKRRILGELIKLWNFIVGA